MDITKDQEINTGNDAETRSTSVNIDKLPVNESQQIRLNDSAGEQYGKEVPIQLQQLVKDKRGYVQTVKRELRVSIDYKSGHTIVSVVEGKNRDVVRHIPQDEILAVERLITAPAGMLFRAQA